MTHLYIGRDGVQYGPFEQGKVRELIARRQLVGTDLVWWAGMASWRPAAEVLGQWPPVSDMPPIAPRGHRPVTAADARAGLGQGASAIPAPISAQPSQSSSPVGAAPKDFAGYPLPPYRGTDRDSQGSHGTSKAPGTSSDTPTPTNKAKPKGRWKRVILVAVLLLVASVIGVSQLPGASEGFTQAFNRSYQQEFDRSYSQALSKAGHGQSALRGASTTPSSPPSPSTFSTPDRVTLLREQIRSQRLHPQSEYTIGEQLDWSFRDPTWQSEQLSSGATLIRFEGYLGPDAAASVRQSLSGHLGAIRMSSPRTGAIEDAISEVQPGTLLQLDFAFRPDGKNVYLERLRTENAVLRDSGLPIEAWLERVLQ